MAAGTFGSSARLKTNALVAKWINSLMKQHQCPYKQSIKMSKVHLHTLG